MSTRQVPAVVDVGAAFLRAGFAGEASPRVTLRSPLAPLLRRRPLPPQADFEAALCGPLAEIYVQHLKNKTRAPRVVVLESLCAPQALRRALAAVLLRELGAPALSFAPGDAAPVWTTGVDSGLVVDVGFLETRVLPVFQGVPVRPAMRVAGVACDAVQAALCRRAMEEQGHAAPGDAGVRDGLFEVWEEVAARAVFVQPADEAAAPEGRLHVPVDGSFMAVSAAARAAAGEVLFEGEEEGAGVAHAVLDALLACPVDARAAVAANVVLCGGGGALPGLGHRLLEECSRLSSSLDRYAAAAVLVDRHLECAPTCFARPCLAWIGGSLLAAGPALPAIMTEEDVDDWLAVSSGDDEEEESGGEEAEPAPSLTASPRVARRQRRRSRSGSVEVMPSVVGLPMFSSVPATVGSPFRGAGRRLR